MRVAIPQERHSDERRVAGTPESVTKLIKLGFDVVVEPNAGVEAGYSDLDYTDTGATVADGDDLWSCNFILKVRPPLVIDGVDEAEQLQAGTTLVSFIQPDLNDGVLDRLAARGVTVLAMERVPRITRAQSMDALSSMANIAGYRAVIEAAQRFGSFFTPQFTAAGKVPPARVLVIGAGVAGLASIGAAKSLGAVVKAFDTRSAVEDQVKSMGAEFLTVKVHEEGEGIGGYAKTMSQAFIEAELALFRSQAPKLDIVVTTALIPGKRAPVLWTKDMVESMPAGSVIVDLAASQGGNCELTEEGKRVVHNGVHVIGYTDLTSRMPKTASRMYSANVCNLIADLGGADFSLDMTDEIVRGCLVLRDGKPPELPDIPDADPVDAALPGVRKRRQTGQFDAVRPPSGAFKPATPSETKKTSTSVMAAVQEASKQPLGLIAASGLSLLLLGAWALMRIANPELLVDDAGAGKFLQHMTIFVLACVVGWHVIWNVTPALHTPLMSVTNAISGIILLGGIMFAGRPQFDIVSILGIAAILLAAINVAGGFLVTQRMLRMFRK